MKAAFLAPRGKQRGISFELAWHIIMSTREFSHGEKLNMRLTAGNVLGGLPLHSQFVYTLYLCSTAADALAFKNP